MSCADSDFRGKQSCQTRYPRLCRDTRPALVAGFVFLGLVISFRHEPVMAAFAEQDVTRDSLAIAIFAICWICKLVIARQSNIGRNR
jgi:hypothetical protein